MAEERPLSAVGSTDGIGRHDFVRRANVAHICKPCGVVYLNPVGNCLLCGKFTTPTEIDPR